MMAIKKKKWKSVGNINIYYTVHFPVSLTMIAIVGMTLLQRK